MTVSPAAPELGAQSANRKIRARPSVLRRARQCGTAYLPGASMACTDVLIRRFTAPDLTCCDR